MECQEKVKVAFLQDCKKHIEIFILFYFGIQMYFYCSIYCILFQVLVVNQVSIFLISHVKVFFVIQKIYLLFSVDFKQVQVRSPKLSILVLQFRCCIRFGCVPCNISKKVNEKFVIKLFSCVAYQKQQSKALGTPFVPKNQKLVIQVKVLQQKHLGLVWLVSSNQHFHILNNISHISIYLFTHIYIKNTQTTLLKLTNQTGPQFSTQLFLKFHGGSFGLDTQARATKHIVLNVEVVLTSNMVCVS